MNTPHYSINLLPDPHLFSVELSISRPDSTGQRLALPSWIPGSYLIREFARHIVSLTAHRADGQTLTIQKLDKASWRVEAYDGPVTVRYQVYAFDLSVRAAYLDRQRGFFNGSSLCLQVVGQEALPHRLELLPPADKAYRDWQVATTLPRQSGKQHGFGCFEAANYDALIDHPVEIGRFSRASFRACGVPHEVAISGQHSADLKRLVRDLKAICEQQIRLFGEPAPFKRYLFLVLAVGDGYGGLEHRDSTALICNRNDLPHADSDANRDAGYRQFLGLCSHEYFHSWNVKRIKPAAYAPYDLSRENYSTLLWAFEGITSYYDDLCLLRSGRVSPATWLQLLGQTLSSVLRSPALAVQTLSDASFDTWIKYYRPDENSPNALVSYYTQGSLVALALDLTLRKRSNGQRSLDDVMRTLWQRYGRDWEAQGQGVGETEWEAIASEVAGFDLSGFFEQTLRQPGLPPLQDLLADFGIDWQLRPALGAADKGGTWQEADEAAPADNWLGARYGNDAGSVKISHVLSGGPAEQAGLAAGDVLVALDGLRITHGNVEQLLNALPAATPRKLHAFRRDELFKTRLQLISAPAQTVALRLPLDAAPSALRDGWLGQ